MKHIFLLLLLFGLPVITTNAQSTSYTEKDYSRIPVWIRMIDDTAVNFFEAEHAFNTYFSHHEKPGGENEDIGEFTKRKKHPSKKMLRKIEQENRMRMEVKKYNHWKQMMLPYVQPDGSILTPSQRLLIHQQIIKNG